MKTGTCSKTHKRPSDDKKGRRLYQRNNRLNKIGPCFVARILQVKRREMNTLSHSVFCKHLLMSPGLFVLFFQALNIFFVGVSGFAVTFFFLKIVLYFFKINERCLLCDLSIAEMFLSFFFFANFYLF